MKNEDWRRMIEAWQTSRKHQEMKKKLNSRRMYNLNKEEIEQVIEEVNEFDLLSDEEKEAFDWLDPERMNVTTKDNLIVSLIQTLIKWHFYLYKHEIAQEYELCAKIRDVITIEINECRRLVRTYFFIEEDDEEIYAALRKESKQKVEQNYQAWVEYLNQD